MRISGEHPVQVFRRVHDIVRCVTGCAVRHVSGSFVSQNQGKLQLQCIKMILAGSQEISASRDEERSRRCGPERSDADIHGSNWSVGWADASLASLNPHFHYILCWIEGDWFFENA